MRREIVLFGIIFNCSALASPSIVETMSTAAGRMNSSAMLCGFLHLAT
uniref:Uncharacterized protein n=1 Tax=Anguilla anguilla TaxID=7936 RepID=A0A0E9XDX0_ANGAN